MALGSVMCFGGSLCKGTSFLTSSAALSVQSQLKITFKYTFFFNEERSREIGGCTPAEVGGGDRGGKALPPLLVVGALGQTLCLTLGLQVAPDHSSGRASSTRLSGCSLKLFFAEASSRRKQYWAEGSESWYCTRLSFSPSFHFLQ